MKSLSQKKIAESCHVSQTVVSLVLNGHENKVAPETYQAVWNYALANGYRTKPKQLRFAPLPERPLQYVGYILRSPFRLATASYFFGHVLQGMDAYLRNQDVHTLFLGSEDDINVENLKRLLQHDPNLIGLVIMGDVKRPFLMNLSNASVKIISVSAVRSGLCSCVNSNEAQAGIQLINHLVALGHTHFGFIGCQYPAGRNQERIESLQSALAQHHLTLNDADCIIEPQAGRADGVRAAEKLLSKSEKPTAWICVGGRVARGATDYILRQRLQPGEDISIACYDMTRATYEEEPSITSASASPELLGETAARLLLDKSNRHADEICDIIVPSTFVQRDSTGPVPLGLCPSVLK
jgi:DNA-binding LacI/PurR family transcriptional regulator